LIWPPTVLFLRAEQAQIHSQARIGSQIKRGFSRGGGQRRDVDPKVNNLIAASRTPASK